ncbi:MAG: putative Ribonuclease H [Streblomastix strix]|uniref:Ribonuclease n=1 Tax=Streblomastix strix TaxID=222440 RepID=A0A5J4VLI0_9EUKA|nr:MAG: putative Ribonuclease H [Streblomastix strix]
MKRPGWVSNVIVQVQSQSESGALTVYVDTFGPPAKYKQYLSYRFPEIRHIEVKAKTDSLYPIESASSICAKVRRDHELSIWVLREEEICKSDEIGSEYPGDPITKSFLNANFDPIFLLPSITRFSWKTVSELGKKMGAYEEGDDEDEEEAGKIVKTKPTLAGMFKKQPYRSKIFCCQ